ncbi:unnamed protein product [Nippostrongylus brasiliensis]|uniref:Glycophorin-A n=1 Tax=Nippostrongylus brasiliensis TaxID=27835 RepID=A0A0N4YM40_NIPBR|nr:hypothetical protein Q1695_007993 [Nippostrongylus brasiliensis]VDL81935.1 unnamed protein product [Nippostrongylus brasiliensis]
MLLRILLSGAHSDYATIPGTQAVLTIPLTYVIIAGSVAGAILLVLLTILTYFVVRKLRRREPSPPPAEPGIRDVLNSSALNVDFEDVDI